MPATDRTPRGAAPVSHRTAGRRRTARGTAAWLLVAVLCSLGLAATIDGPAAATPAAPAGRACPTGDGVTVLIDFDGQDGRYDRLLSCAPGRPATGLTALAEAGVGHRGATRSPGFVCQIEGIPAADPCVNESPAKAYWSYWLAERGSGEWCLSTTGGGGREPQPGTVEAWSFSKDTTSSTTRPPSIAPPPALPGAPAAAIPASHCSYKRPPSVPSKPPTTTPPATVPPPTAAPGGGSSTGGGGSSPSGSPQSSAGTGGSTKPGDAPGSGTADKTTSDGSKPDEKGAKPSASTSDTADADETGADETGADEAETEADGESSSSKTADARAANRKYEADLAAANAAAPGSAGRKASGASDEKGGSPLPLLFAAVAVVIVVGTGIRASRRNRAAS